MAATVIGAHARISGSIELDDADAPGDALDVRVLGRVVGAIRARGVIHLAAGADVRGELEGARVIIDDGAYFEGQVRLRERSAPAAARPEPSRPAAPRPATPAAPAPIARAVPELSSPGRRRLARRTP